jgi:hypothetical protein
MPHPFFDAGSYPWGRADAQALKEQLRTVIPNVPDIVIIYEQSGGDRAALDSNAAPDVVWHRALSLLANAGRLREFIEELEQIKRLQGNASFQAAIRAVREATPTPQRPGQTPTPISTPIPTPIPKPFPVTAKIVIGVLLVAILIFVGSLVAQGVFKVDVPWLPGTGEPATVARLQNGPRAEDSGGVITTIERVDQVGDRTEIELTIQNNLPDTISLPASLAALVGADGTSVKADPFAGSWTDSIPAGQLSRGTIVLDGVLPPGATTATFSFSTVFVQGPGGPDSIIVPGLAIAAVPE